MAMGAAPMPISFSSGHFALRYEVPKFLARGGHLCMAVLTIAMVLHSIFGGSETQVFTQVTSSISTSV